jgi:hypothetical protein
MIEQNDLPIYHVTEENGYWTGTEFMGAREIKLNGENRDFSGTVTPLGIEEREESLAMKLSTFEGEVFVPIDDFPGLTVVRGDSINHPHETDGELLIEINYFRPDGKDEEPRRIRPTGIMFGIMGDTDPNISGSEHRWRGESADFYLEGHDTQYDPGNDGNSDLRSFPFWRLGIYGSSAEMAQAFLPEAPQEQ